VRTTRGKRGKTGLMEATGKVPGDQENVAGRGFGERSETKEEIQCVSLECHKGGETPSVRGLYGGRGVDS